MCKTIEFNKYLPHTEVIRYGNTYSTNSGFHVTPVVYSCGLEYCLAFICSNKTINYSTVIEANIQHTGNDYDLAKVTYFFEELSDEKLPIFAVGVNNTTARRDEVTGDVILIDPVNSRALSSVKIIGPYAREKAFLNAVVNVKNCDKSFLISCTNGAEYSIESLN